MSDVQATPATPRARAVHVVPHTHWDREWYREFERYRVRLVRTLDRVLAGNLPYFLLDGQTAVLDDYLVIRPEQGVRLREKIRQGHLGVGPWFVLVDEFLVSGESLVRNLQAGRAAMHALGTQGEGVGYLPDMFGHVAQMPQVLAQFGLDRAVVWRGVAPATTRFRWKAPDGTAVTAAWLPLGYYQTMLMEELTLEARSQQLAKYVESFPGDEPVWLLAGADHMAPRADLTQLMTSVQRTSPSLMLSITSLRDAIAGTPPKTEVVGELRDPSKSYLLPGVLSARVPLKQANAACQTLLERYVEPLAALAWWQGRTHPTPFLAYAWRTLMLNHPHDSICGCSIDEVHREMWPRFAAVEQVGEELLVEAVRLHDRPQENPGVFIFNPTSVAWEGWVELTLDWPRKESGTPEALALAGPGLLAQHGAGYTDTDSFRAEIDFNPDWFPVRRFALAARVALPALGGIQLQAQAAETPSVAESGVQAMDDRLENSRLVVTVAQGQVTLHDKLTGRTYPNCHGFLDEGDAGDEYNFSPPAGDLPIRAQLASARCVELTPYAATLELRYTLELPVGLSADRSRRSAETVPLELTSRLTLRAEAAGVEVETRYDNIARDHRLRLVVGWPGAPRPRVLAEGSFGVFERAAVAAPVLPVAKGMEAVMPEFPTSGFTALVADDGCLGLAGPGLYEAAWLAEGALGVTLLRAVGWLSRDDLRTRGGGAGPRFETPEAQERGAHVARYLLVPAADWPSAMHAAAAFNAPPRVWVGAGVAAPGLAWSDPRIVTSALTRSQDGESLVLRAFNAGPEPVSATLETGLDVRQLRTSRLDESVGEAVVGTKQDFRPYEIKTWLVAKPL